jgi:hypothetical protein
MNATHAAQGPNTAPHNSIRRHSSLRTVSLTLTGWQRFVAGFIGILPVEGQLSSLDAGYRIRHPGAF